MNTRRGYLFLIMIVIFEYLLGVNSVKASRLHPTQVAIAEVDIYYICKNINQFQLKTGKYPRTYPELLQALETEISVPEKQERRDGIYMLIPIGDPWMEEYRYAFPGFHNKKTFDVLSKGQDGQLGTADDVNNWDEKHSWREFYSPGWLEQWWEEWFWVWDDLFLIWMLGTAILLEVWLESWLRKRKKRKSQ